MITAKEANKILRITRENTEIQARAINFLKELNNEIIELSKNGMCETNLQEISKRLNVKFDGKFKDIIIEVVEQAGYLTDGLRVVWGIEQKPFADSLTDEEWKNLSKTLKDSVLVDSLKTSEELIKKAIEEDKKRLTFEDKGPVFKSEGEI
jgi:hypothetical protein